MDKTTHEVRLEQWKQIVKQCQERPEGQTAAAWLEENGIHNKQYYYWLRQIRRQAYEEMKKQSLPSVPGAAPVAFAELPLPQSAENTAYISTFHPDAVICLGRATIAVCSSTSKELLSRIMEAMTHAC